VPRQLYRAAVLASLAGLGSGTPALAGAVRDAALPLITDIKAIRALSQDEGARRYPVRIHGVVTHFDEKLASLLFVNDGQVGQFVVPPPRAEQNEIWRSLRTGDVVEIEGHTIRGGFAPNVEPERVHKIGHGALPVAKSVPYSALLTGRHDCEYVEAIGVVQRTWLSSGPPPHILFADVALEDGVMRAQFWSYSDQDLEHLINARVRVRGNVGSIFGSTEQLRGVSLLAGRARDIEILESPPDPFALPIRAIRNIYNYSLAGEVDRRIRVRGVVTSRVPGRFVELRDFTTESLFRYIRHVLYVKDQTGAARIETEQTLDVKPGDLVEVAGFAAVTPGKPILRNALVRVVGTTDGPSPVPVASDSVLSAESDAELVRVDAQLLGVLTTPTERVLVLRSRTRDAAFEAGLDRSRDGDELNKIRPGSLVNVTGVYSYQAGPPPSFRLFLRSPSDVVVVAAAPWWTLQHTLVMLVMFALAGIIGAFWLKTHASRQQQEYQAVLTERNRVARELHDTLEQGLAGIGLQLEAVAGSLQSAPATAQQSLDVARQMLRYSFEETRRSVMDLRSQALESRDLAGALANLARQMTLGTSTIAEVRLDGQPRRLDAAEEHHLLRIGLEALTNALKHGAPTRIDIELRFRADGTDLIVQDDGRGLQDSEAISGSHFGLQGVRERVNKLGGVLEIHSRPGEGTRLAVSVPVASRGAGTSRARDAGGRRDGASAKHWLSSSRTQRALNG
jgi:signal transduction histidine kinase